MSNKNYHLVHANVALARASLDDKIMRGFLDQVEEINLKASLSPGFVSQPTPSDSGEIYQGDFLLNMSIWESVESLDAFTHSGRHAKALENRYEWFKEQSKPNYVLFWFPEGETPTELEVSKRIEYSSMYGAKAYAFNFQCYFTSDEAEDYEPIFRAQ